MSNFTGTFVLDNVVNYVTGSTVGEATTPTDFESLGIFYFGSDTVDVGVLELGVAGASQIPGVTVINVAFPGGPNFPLTWSVGNLRYEGAVTGLAALLEATEDDTPFSLAVAVAPTDAQKRNSQVMLR